SALGSGIATAFVATLYGVGVANLLFFPLASRLRERHEFRMKQREALAHALTALAAHESPSTIVSLFATHASPADHDMAQRLKKMASQ
ncbi:MAG TPA: MotA/TolQ/ExbB proton channel family protein, partial [Pyrinomonadaceae bacterium]|nr:MotA/TolQ/ExbB proton channel family protein [Pyrinomonadaceae bacterium]